MPEPVVQFWPSELAWTRNSLSIDMVTAPPVVSAGSGNR